ncbi:MAG: caspase family protein [Rhizobiaceae bacterium]|nr:caspase family protein [Rhizobiaceae bacterium]
MGRIVLIATAIVALFAAEASAQSRRVALVLGNAAYESTAPLANPVNDAADLAAKLRAVGFEVIEGKNLGKRELERAVGEFADALTGASVGMLFYAGHGIQVDGRNYIVPTDARLDAAVKLQLEAVPIDEILDIMEQQATTSLVFLDACRNNPFARGNGLATDRSAKALGGLAQFDASRGSFIAFSTSPGAVALDGSGRNSPFAAALLSHIATPGQSINDLMIAVRRDVIAATSGQQRPWEQGSLLERFAFVPDGSAPPAAAPAPAPETQVAALERSVGDSTSIEALVRDDYLAPNPAALAETVQRLYASPATIFGTPYETPAIVAMKTTFFAQFASWTLALEPGTLTVTPRGEGRADIVFDMRYQYVARAAGVPTAEGRARVYLGLMADAGRWRIASEASEVLP